MPDGIANVIDMASTRAVADHWMGRLAKSGEGAILPNEANATIIIANDPALAGAMAFNDFTATPLLMRPLPPLEEGGKPMPGPYPRPWGPSDVILTLAYLQRVFSPRFAKTAVEHAMLVSAEQNRFHPVCDWLEGLAWDGKPRLDNWLINAFACEATDFNRAVGAKFLIAAVRRVRQPGCKFDNMLVLEGKQNLGKSKALKTLFGEDWFSDDVPRDLPHKDAAMALLGVWGLEFAELASLIKNDDETAKAFLSREVDRYRPPYGKNYVERRRQVVLCGSTNEDDYLRDPTGNRRYWPVYCETADFKWVELHREQLWAEAAYRDSQGENIWLDDQDLIAEANTVQSQRVAGDVWEDRIARWLKGRREATISDILEQCLGFTPDRMRKSEEMRVAKVLKLLHWQRKVTRSGKIWVPGE